MIGYYYKKLENKANRARKASEHRVYKDYKAYKVEPPFKAHGKTPSNTTKVTSLPTTKLLTNSYAQKVSLAETMHRHRNFHYGNHLASQANKEHRGKPQTSSSSCLASPARQYSSSSPTYS